MSTNPSEIKDLPPYTVVAHNTSADSENKIHDDAVAAEYGFKGGLVPGIAVYAYVTVPVIQGLGPQWLERGLMHVRFQKPVYERDRVTVRSCIGSCAMALTAERDDGVIAARANTVSLKESQEPIGLSLADYPELPMPSPELRLPATREQLIPGASLGTLKQRLDLAREQPPLLDKLGERLPIYYGSEAVAHPYVLLALSNQFLMRNVKLGPWIHTESGIINCSVARDGDEISVRGRIQECFERNGHEFVVLDLLLACGDRIVQYVKHTAIYRIRPSRTPAA